MRVIAGRLKGRQLKAVPGKATRPTTDKVKEAVFQRMGPFFEDGYVLDLFAGSGSLGIEALSRGMAKAIFVDKSPKAIHTINENLRNLQIEDQAEVYCTDAFLSLKATAKRGLVFDLIIIDPPYGKGEYEKILKKVFELGIVRENSILYCEHDLHRNMPTETDIDGLSILKQQQYGGTIGITIYRCKGR